MGWGSMGQANIVAMRLMLLGGPQFRAQLAGSAAGIRMLSRATNATGMAMRTGAKRTWLMNQALFTFHRYAFLATSIAIGLGAGLVKLGVSYLAAKDSALAALGPSSGIFKSSKAFRNEFNQLFQLAKYSPFVIGDLVTAFRVMYPVMHASGLGVGLMNRSMKALVNFMSQAGKTTPANFNRVSYAIQHMLNQGRLTGRLYQQLSQNGIPMGLILKQMGIADTNLSNLSRLNIDPKNVLNAIVKFSQTLPYKNAAFRISMNSFPGMLQVARDSLSQFMGTMLSPTYDKFKNRMAHLLEPGSALGRLGNTKNAHDAVISLSRTMTGGQGLGQGLLLLISIVSKLGSLIIHALIPAFVIALHSLAIFLPILWPLNKALGFLTRHVWLVKYALVPFATWLVIVRGATLGLAFAQAVLNLATFGVMRGFTVWKAAVVLMYAWEGFLTVATWLLTTAFGALAGAEFAAMIALTPLWVTLGVGLGILVAIGAAIYLIIRYWRQLQNLAQGKLFGNSTFGKIGGIVSGGAFKGVVNTFTGGLGGVALGMASGGTAPYSGTYVVGEKGPEIVNLPQGSRITPNDAVKSIGSLSQIAGSDRPQVFQVILDRKVLAEANARATQDKEARR